MARQRLEHPIQHSSREDLGRVEAEFADDAAHGLLPLRSRDSGARSQNSIDSDVRTSNPESRIPSLGHWLLLRERDLRAFDVDAIVFRISTGEVGARVVLECV